MERHCYYRSGKVLYSRKMHTQSNRRNTHGEMDQESFGKE